MVTYLQVFDIFRCFYQVHTAFHLPHGTFDFRVTKVADHDDFAPGRAHFADFHMYFGHQWAGCIEYAQPSGFCFLPDRLGNPVRTENNSISSWYFIQLLDKYGPFIP